MGEGWAPAVLNTREEMDFIIQGQKGFSDNRNYWIGGRTNVRGRSIDYSEYIPTEQLTFPVHVAGKLSQLIGMITNAVFKERAENNYFDKTRHRNHLETAKSVFSK